MYKKIILRFIKLILCSLVLFSLFSRAETEINEKAHQEIVSLLDDLGNSNCMFNRNGSWYKADKAKTHLLSKLEYIEGKTYLTSAEQFIELGATKSSWTGTPYMVSCNNVTEASNVWLLNKLTILRSKQNYNQISPLDFTKVH